MMRTSVTTGIPTRSPSLGDGNDRLLQGLPPVFRGDAKVLILGSLPGARSLAQQQYYANPRNQFWHLIGEVINLDLKALDYSTRLAWLMEHRIALWDVVATGHRRGSLDAALRVVERSNLDWLVGQLPQLRALAFNGKLAAQQAPELAMPVQRLGLPSSSPANTTPLTVKLAQWTKLGVYLTE